MWVTVPWLSRAELSTVDLSGGQPYCFAVFDPDKTNNSEIISPAQLFPLLTQLLLPLVATNYTASSGSNN